MHRPTAFNKVNGSYSNKPQWYKAAALLAINLDGKPEAIPGIHVSTVAESGQTGLQCGLRSSLSP